ncbi:unnamed protein product [Brachionus calyciflorus]|uniref:RRM domain-containing protein n=1 Tax=Brachionus calyciflorus TaxID=104777 RepID=A0A813QXW1_9BILA|nr:unnamed protein product [Brachionus calyciflorus]
MSNKKNKIILTKIPVEIDVEDLRIVFESNAFGYQLVVNLTENVHVDRKFKDVIIEFESPEAAREVAKVRAFPFEFDRHQLVLRPILYLENFDATPKPIKEEVVEIFTCWIGNIPAQITEDKLKIFFEKQISNTTEKFHSINILLDPKLKKYQCSINFFNQNDALKAVELFDGSKLNNHALEAKLKLKDNSISETISESDSESTSSDTEIEETEQTSEVNSKYFEKIFQLSSVSNFRSLILKQVEAIKEKYSSGGVSISPLTGKKGVNKKGIRFQVKSDNQAKLNECFNELKSKVKIQSRKIKFTPKEFNQVSKLKADLIKLKLDKNQEFFYLFTNDKKKYYSVEFFDTGDKNLTREFHKYLNRVQKYFDEKLDSEREVQLNDQDHLDFIKMYLLKRKNLNISHAPNSNKLIISGKKINLDKLNLTDLLKNLEIIQIESKIQNKSIITYMNFKLKDLKFELESRDLLLKYNKIENGSESYQFKIISSNVEAAKQKAVEIVDYFTKVKLLVVNIDDVKVGKSIENELKAQKISNIDVKYREDKKKFFINGIDFKKMNEMKQQIELRKKYTI